MIILCLLHPQKSTPVQCWSYKDELLIRIGRAVDNQVILYSAVVSRHHVELRWTGSNWEFVNLSANGTYVKGQRYKSGIVVEGSIIRLAQSGPQLLIRLN